MNHPSSSPALSFGPFTLLVRERRLERDGTEVKVGSRALDVLVALTQRAGIVMSHDELRSSVWPDTSVEESGLRAQVAALRRALREYGAGYVTNVPGRGYCFVAAVAPLSPSEASEAPPGPAHGPERRSDRTTAPHSLPGRLARIVGREAELEELSSLVTQQRVVTVVAAGGMGKSTVAVAAVHALRGLFHDDVHYVDLASLGEEHIVSALATVLGLSPMEPVARLAAALEHRRLLLLLDGCEHVVARAALVVRDLVAGTDALHVLLTSREPLRIDGERVFRLSALAAPPDSAALTSDEARAFPAVQLFVERATSAGSQLTSTHEETRTIARMCRQLDGIALAIEITAGRVEAYGVPETAALLDTRFQLLWRGRRTAVTRHQTLGAMLDWSYNLLTEIERCVLRRLSILAGACSMVLIRAVACEESDKPDAVMDGIAALVEKSLLAVDSGADGTRYRLLETTRAYAQSKLTDAEGHGAWMRLGAALVKAAGSESLQASRSDADPGHIACVRAALTWAFSSAGDPRLAVALAERAGPLFVDQSLLWEAERWSQAGLSGLPSDDAGTRREMNLQATLGLAALSVRGNTPSAHAAVTRALALTNSRRDGWLQLSLIAAISLFETRAAAHRDALASAERAEAVALQMADPAALALAEWSKGRAKHLLGDPASAERLCRSSLTSDPSLPRAARLVAFDHRSATVVTVARALWLLGRADEARAVARRIATDSLESGRPIAVATALAYTSQVYVWCGDLGTAAELVERLMTYTHRHGPDYVHRLLGPALRAELAVRTTGSGTTALREASSALAAEGHMIWKTAFATALSEAVASRGEWELALSLVDEAIASTTMNGGSYDLPEMLRVKGHVLAATPGVSFDEAERCLLSSIDTAQQQGAIAWELRSATTLGGLWSARGRDREARELVAPSYERFTQGFDTRDLTFARAFLSGP